jgi:hypothetical protein
MVRMLSLPYPIEASVICWPCLDHSDCVEYSLVPHDSAHARYGIHSSLQDFHKKGLTQELVQIICRRNQNEIGSNPHVTR